MSLGGRQFSVIFLALILLSSPVTASIPSSTFPDTSSTEVDGRIIDTDPPTGAYVDGESVSGEVTVENTGSSEHTYYVGYDVVDPEGENRNNDGTTGTTLTLAPGETETVEVSWSVEGDAPVGTYDVVFALWEESDPDNLNNRLDNEDHNDAFRVEEEEVEGELDFVSHPSGSFASGDTVEAEAEVTNDGNVENTYYVGYSGIDSSGEEWDNDGTTGTTVTLEPGESEVVDISWKVEDDTPEDQYDSWVALWEEDDPDDLQTRLDEDEDYDAFRVEEEEVDGELSFVEHPDGAFTERETVEAQAEVTNDGDIENTYYVGYSGIDSSGDEWNNDGTTGTTVTLESGESEVVDVSWEVEDDAPEDQYDSWVALWEEEDPDNLHTRLDEDEEYDAFRVEEEEVDGELSVVEHPDGTFVEGETVEARAEVINDGDVENTYYVGYSGIDSSGEEWDNDGTTGTTVTLESGESEVVDVSWEVEDDTPEDQYDSWVALWEEDDPDDLQTRLDEDEEYDAFRVEEEEIDGELSFADHPDGSYTEGETVKAEAEVINDGDVENTYYVGYSGIDSNGEEWDNDRTTGTTVTLEPGETEVVDVSWEVEADAPAGEYDSWVALWEEDDPDNLHTRLDEDEEYDAFRVEKEVGGSITEVEGLPEQYVLDEPYDTTVEVSNPTNVDQEYTVSIPDQSGLEVSGSSEKQVTVPAGESKSVSFGVELYGTDTERTVTAVLDAQNGTELDERSVSTEPETAGQIDVSVVDEQGEPIPDVTVVPYDDSDASATTDREGQARLTNVSSGETLVYIDDEMYDRDYIEVNVEQGETADVEFTVDETANVAGTISDEVGAAVESGTVVVDGREADIQNGEFAFDRPFEPGSKEVHVRVNGTVVQETEERLETGDNGLEYDVSVPEEGDLSTAELAYIATGSFASTAYKGFIFGDSGSSTGAIGSDSDAYETGSGLEAAEEVTSEQIDRRIAESHGAAVGLGTGLKEAVEGVIELVKDPLGIIGDMISLVQTVLDDLGVLEEILAMIPQQIQDKQQEANPHEADSELNESFAYGWYGGYVTAYIAEGVLGSKGVSKISKASKLDEVRRAPNKKDVFEKNYNKKSGSTPDFFDDLDPSVSTQLKKLDSSTQQRLKGLRDENKLTDADIEQLGTLIDGGLGARQAGQLLEFSFENADQFRTAIIRHGDQVDSDRLNRYIDDLDAAQSHENIENIKGLTQAAANTRSAGARDDITGQYGETKQALKYAQEGKRVEVEPGDGALDLKVTDGSSKELVEVKTRVKGKDTDYQYISGRLTEVERKVNNAKANPDVDVSDSDVVLEINTGTKGSDLENTKSAARQTVEDSTGDLAVDKIRLVADDGSVETIPVDK